MRAGLLHRVQHGDVMAKWPFGGMFVAEEVAAEQARFDSRETVSAGPIFGRKTFPAKYEAAASESALLEEAGLSRESFAQFGKLLAGTRRHNLIYIDDLAADLQLTNLQLTFTLPAGSYATVLLQHVMKTTVASDEPIVED
jgi:tRNA pseudouridine13 synthase